MVRRTVLYTGHVQGVCFRLITEAAARSFQVTGYVRNLPDGRVELVAEGALEEVEGLLGDVAKRMEGGIRAAHVSESPPTGEFEGFRIRYG